MLCGLEAKLEDNTSILSNIGTSLVFSYSNILDGLWIRLFGCHNLVIVLRLLLSAISMLFFAGVLQFRNSIPAYSNNGLHIAV